jgi:hypothetical protein
MIDFVTATRDPDSESAELSYQRLMTLVPFRFVLRDVAPTV